MTGRGELESRGDHTEKEHTTMTPTNWIDITDEPAPPFPEQSIELDCPPGDPRPGDLIAEVILGTGLPARPARSKVFGNWVWDYSDIDPEAWAAAKAIVGPRIARLHDRGVIRYGSW